MATAQTYQVQTSHVEDLLHVPSIAFQVPEFQRRYAWDSEKVDDLMTDLYGDDDWWTDRNDVEPYFLGSIVLARSPGAHHLLLDGQQRLTTITLLIASLKHRLLAEGHKEAQALERYLLAGRFGEPLRPKILLQPEDAEGYERLLHNPSSATDRQFRGTPLGRAVQRIIAGIDDTLQRGEQRGCSKRDVLERMVKRLVYEVEVVKIEASTESQAFRLFETLNDRGLPLNGADLVKNKLLSQAGPFKKEAREAWVSLTNQIKGSEILNFLRHYWIAFHEPVRKDNLYKEYVERSKDLTPNKVLAFAQSLEGAARIYKHITAPLDGEQPWGPETAEALKRLADLRARSCRPLLLYCATHFREEIPQVVTLCETASVRHTLVSGRNPNQLDKAYAAICRALRDGNRNVISAILQELDGLVPNDEDFSNSLQSAEVSVTPAWRAVLERLNDQMSTGETRVAAANKVHVEHILPRSPSEAALAEAGLNEIDAREFALRLGNLTLLSGKKNQSISNHPFSIKRAAFHSSEIALNRYVAEQNRWGKDEIERRGRKLGEAALLAWRWPKALPRPSFDSDSYSSSQSSDVALTSQPRRPRNSPSPAAPSGSPLPRLTGKLVIRGTVWVPRILWALEYASRRALGPRTAADIARILEEHAAVTVPATNIARAFRDHAEDEDPPLWDEIEGRRYVINTAGRDELARALATSTALDAPKGVA